jgi:hypothetical protein
MDRYTDAPILKTANTNRPYYKARFYPNVPLSESDVYVFLSCAIPGVVRLQMRYDEIMISFINFICI